AKCCVACAGRAGAFLRRAARKAAPPGRKGGRRGPGAGEFERSRILERSPVRRELCVGAPSESGAWEDARVARSTPAAGGPEIGRTGDRGDLPGFERSAADRRFFAAKVSWETTRGVFERGEEFGGGVPAAALCGILGGAIDSGVEEVCSSAGGAGCAGRGGITGRRR